MGGAQLVAASLVLVPTLLNCVGLVLVSRVQNALTVIKVAVITAFVLLGVTPVDTTTFVAVARDRGRSSPAAALT